VSAPESAAAGTSGLGSAPAPRVHLAACTADIIEIAALRARTRELADVAAGRGLNLPACGRVTVAPAGLALCVRPERWLLLGAAAAPGAAVALWQEACGAAGTAVELSSGLAVLRLAGPAVPEVLSRGCRLDLDPGAFPAGAAAASVVAQVAVILARLPSGMLLLTPASTARHVREWLATAALACGLALRADVTVAALCGDEAP
jgi:heterotetrameric sarcosine oxidase gamma subunit